MSSKDKLKEIIRNLLGSTASALFLDKSLDIINESADTRESLLAATERISKRTAIFISAELAGRVHNVLTQEIKRMPLEQGNKRMHPRVVFHRKVRVTCDGKECELNTKDLSQGGVRIDADDPYPVGSRLLITLPLEAGSKINVGGIVVRSTAPGKGRQPSGMGVAFKDISGHDLGTLKDFIRKVLKEEGPLG